VTETTLDLVALAAASLAFTVLWAAVVPLAILVDRLGWAGETEEETDDV
jgi:hypothetical protein